MKLEEISKIAKETGYDYYEYRHAHSSIIDTGYSRYLFKKRQLIAKILSQLIRKMSIAYGFKQITVMKKTLQ